MDFKPSRVLDSENTSGESAQTEGDRKEEGVVRVGRTIVLSPEQGRRIDGTIVSFPYYNSFNYSLLPRRDDGVQLTLGITSPNPGEGKSLAAANLAVSLGLGYRKKTILVDANLSHPTAHETFDLPEGPGLCEALDSGTIHVRQSKVPRLHILTAGFGSNGTNGVSTRRLGRRKIKVLRLDQLESFNHMMDALEQEYEFVIVDMPAINSGQFPVLFANRLSGLLVVIDTTRTKRADVDRMFRQLNERQVMGFIYNRTHDDSE